MRIANESLFRNANPGRRGSALILSLVAVATVVVLAASFTQFASSLANRQAQAVNRKRAFYLAEAGLAEAYAGLACGRTGNVGTEELPALLGDGVFWTEATDLGNQAVKLESTGMIGTGRAVLSLVARRGEESIAALGAFSSAEISLSKGSLVDAYDSTKGEYSAQSDKTGAALGSNSGIFLEGTPLKPTKVKGDVTAGPDQVVSTIGSVTVTGDKAKALAKTELPAVDVPELTLGGAQDQSSPYPLVIPSGSVGYQSLTVHSGSQAIIQGPAQVVLGSLALESTAQLSFDTQNGAVELYVLDGMSLAAQSLLTNTSHRPEDVLIQVPGQTTLPVALGSQGPFHGVIYLPQASAVVGSSFELFGALVADKLTFSGAAKLHFDRHLTQLAAESALPGLLSWRIVDLGSSSGDLAMDPFDLLDLDRNLLPPPSKAHEDQFLVIDYYDFSDVYHRYQGLESHFDWTVVKDVITATRDGVSVVFPRAKTKKAGVMKNPGVLPVVDGPMI